MQPLPSLRKEGRLWTFGQGDSNQLGQGITEDSSNQVLPCEIEDAFEGHSMRRSHGRLDSRRFRVDMGLLHLRSSGPRVGPLLLTHSVTETGRPERVQGLEGHRFVAAGGAGKA